MTQTASSTGMDAPITARMHLVDAGSHREDGTIRPGNNRIDFVAQRVWRGLRTKKRGVGSLEVSPQ